MSGLFDMLIAAARGAAPVIRQRPRPHFAPEEPIEPGAIEAEAGEESPRPLARARTAPPADERPGPEAPAAARRRRSAARPAEETEGAADRIARGRAATGRRRGEVDSPAAGPARREPAAATGEAEPIATAPDPRRDAGRTGSDRPDRPERAAPPEPVAAEPKPLLPELMSEPRAAAGDGPETRFPSSEQAWPPTADGDAGAPRIELRIGRIEVTGPPTQAPAPAARPVIVPRARPRQSLDDYLSRRRR